jgi:hypothetical protein
MSVTSGFRLCFALRPAGRALASGFAWVSGCPGGAEGFLMLAKIGLCSLADFFPLDFFTGISEPFFAPV